MTKEINGKLYWLHSCLSGEQFWMPDECRKTYWATDFWDLEQAIALTQGLPFSE